MGMRDVIAEGKVENGVFTVSGDFGKQVFVSDKHKHKFSDWEIKRESSCTSKGLQVRSCGCRLYEEVETETVPHKFDADNICQVCKSYNPDLVTLKLSDDGGYYIFSGLESNEIVSFEIPSTYKGLPVQEIGDKAFEGCNKLTGIIIPDSVISIGDNAFYNCSALTCVTIPESVTSIGNYAFNGCSSLTEITIPSSVTSIGESAFYNCPIESATIPTKVINFIPTGDLKSVIVTGGESIGNNAFNGCGSLTSVTIPDSVKSIGDAAFRNCTSLASITLPDSVTSVGGGVFYGCTDLKTIILSKNITQLPTYFDDWSDIYYGFFGDCSSLTSIEIPDSVAKIGNFAFKGCSSLTSINVSENNNSLKSVNGNIYSKDGKTLVLYAFGKSDVSFNIPDGVTSIGSRAFQYNTTLTSINISDSVTDIASWAFDSCTSLTSINIPESVTIIRDYTFRGCSSLADITIPESVTSIGGYAFSGCSYLTIYCEAKSVPSGWNNSWNSSKCPVVWDCKNNDIATDGNIYTIIDGVRYALKDGKATVSKQPENIKEANIPASVTYKGKTYSVTNIEESAFMNCGSLASIVLPDSVITVGGGVFYSCANLKTVTLGKNITELPAYKVNSSYYGFFENCTSLTDIAIPNSITSIGGDAFRGCTSLKSITIGKGVNNIEEYAFCDCKSLISVTIPNGVTEIKKSTFEGCSSMTSVTVPDSVTAIRSDAFRGCDKLFVTENGVQYVNNWCVGLAESENKQVTIRNGTKAIADKAFYNCEKLTSVIIPDSVTSIGISAFEQCSSLTSIEIPDSVTYIEGSAFEGCSSLTSITIPDSVTYIGYNAFKNCNAIAIHCEAESRPSDWDSDWSSKRPVIWDCNNNDIANDGYIYAVIDGVRYALEDGKANVAKQPENIKEANIPASVTFKGKTYSVTYIAGFAFKECSSLTSVTIPKSVTKIGGWAFQTCRSLKDVYYEGTIEQWNAIEIYLGLGFDNCIVHCTDGDVKGF